MSQARKLMALAGILVLLLAACGPAATPAPTATAQPTRVATTPTPVTGATPTPTRAAATPAPSPTPAFRIGGKLRLQSTEPGTLDPHAISTAGYDSFHIFDPLLRLNRELRVDPALAQSWETPDATTLVFKLRQGVKFHDGSPFNAQVAKWNFDRIVNPETVSPFARQAITNVDKVEVVDDYTLRLKLKKPDSALLYYLGVQQLSMMTPTAVAKWGRDVGAHPVGTGPYVFQEWVPQSRLTMTRNASYWNSPQPYIQDLEWVPTNDPAVIMASLLTGAFDLSQVATPEHLDRLEKTPGFKLNPVPSELAYGLFINHLRPPMNNLDFRRALDLALDREAMVKALLGGRGTPATTLVSPSFLEHNASLPPVKRDLAKARELLAKAGYKGETVEFVCAQYSAIIPRICEAMQAQFKEAGINAQITMSGDSAVYVKALGQLLYDISILTSSHVPLELRITIYFHSGGRINQGRFGSTPEARRVDQLVEEIGSTYDASTRKRLFDELQKIVYDNVLDIYTMYGPSYYVTRDRVQNFQANPGGYWLATTWVKD